MGGKAFTRPPFHLQTPRLPLSLYHSLSTHLLSLLCPLYAHASIPHPAPQKSSYGDIDILVSDPLDPSPTTSEALAKLLGAQATAKSGRMRSFAVPWPEKQAQGAEEWYVQVDIQAISKDQWAWELMMASHGDFWNILGTSLHRAGLTANDVGLHVRIAEIEKENRKKSMIFLSAQPAAVMRFLGLEEGRFWEGYGTERDMWGCICRSRFWRQESYRRGGMRASERKRWEGREGYRRFVEWVEGTLDEQNGEQGEGSGRDKTTRGEVLEKALEEFGKKGEYEERVEQWRREKGELAKKQGTREARKARAMEEGEYADAWIGCLERRGCAGAGPR